MLHSQYNCRVARLAQAPTYFNLCCAVTELGNCGEALGNCMQDGNQCQCMGSYDQCLAKIGCTADFVNNAVKACEESGCSATEV